MLSNTSDRLSLGSRAADAVLAIAPRRVHWRYTFWRQMHRAKLAEIELTESGLHFQDFANVFVWVPKAAGTSIVNLLSRDLSLRVLKYPSMVVGALKSGKSTGLSVSFGHMNTDWLIRSGACSPQVLETAYTFAIVRNPFERAVSLHSYLQRIGRVPRSWRLERFLDEVWARPTPIGPFNSSGLSQAQPMVRWIFPDQWMGPESIFRVEDGLGSLMKELRGIGVVGSLPKLNASPERSTATPITETSIDLIRRIYEEDFSAFGYPLALPPSLVSTH